MEVLILNEGLESVALIDTFESIIWTDRFDDWGDFEIFTSMNQGYLEVCKANYYLWQKDSDRVMIIEDILIDSDGENGDSFVAKGRSLESILERRIVWNQTVLTGKLQDGIQKLLNENIIAPKIEERRITGFLFSASTDPEITTLTVDEQFYGENLYDVIRTLCISKNIGFRVTLSEENQFVFCLYKGDDRSYDQLKNPYVIFSPEFDNILTSNYVESQKTLKTVALVGGEGEGVNKRMTIATVETGGIGLGRREMYVNAGDVSSKVEGRTLSSAEYLAQLTQRGMDELTKNKVTQSFEGQVQSGRMYQYGKDFFMGDMVQFANEYGIEAKVRVVEFIHSQGTEGVEVYPTFRKVEGEEQAT